MNEITVIDRAIKALNVNEAALRELVKESAEIVKVTNSAGHDQAQTARMKLRNARVSVQKAGKTAREDATAFSKAVIDTEKKYIGIIEPEESRLQAAQDEFTDKIEAEKQAKIQKEIDRKTGIQDAINHLDTGLKFGDTSKSIQEKLDRIASISIDADVFQDRVKEAMEKRNKSISDLVDALESVKAAEKAKADQAAAVEILRKQAEEDRLKLEQARAKLEAEAQGKRDRIDEEERKKAEAKRKLEEEDRFKAQKIAEAQRAEEKKIAEIEAEKLQKQNHEERAKRIAAEQETVRLKAEAQAIVAEKAREDAARAEEERKAASAPDKVRLRAYAESLLALQIPTMSTADAIGAANGIEQAVLSLYKRIVAKAEEL